MESVKSNQSRTIWNRRLTFLIFGLVFGIVLPLYAYKIYIKQDYTDFSVYYLAASRARTLQWDHVYNFLDGASPYRYAPPWILLFLPFSWLTLPQAQVAWYLFQFFFFGFGFYWIYRSLKICMSNRDPQEALFFTCLSLVAILRLCLDTFTIGQVSSLMFFGFSVALHAWITRKSIWTVSALLIPTLLKIGPGIVLGVFLSERTRKRFEAGRILLFGTLSFVLLTWLFIPSWDAFKVLWKGWLSIVQNDSVYYDASHYGSQSIHSCLLRFAKWGWLSIGTASRIETGLALALLGITSGFWWLRKPRDLAGRALSFSLGLFIYMLLMPETFKYSLTPLAIPFALLCTTPSKKKWVTQWTRGSLVFLTLTLSFAGKDIIGDWLFFWLQNHSVPLLAVTFLAISTFLLAWEHSAPSQTFKRLRSALLSSPQEFPLWKSLPRVDPSTECSILAPVALGPEYFANPKEIIQTLRLWHETWSQTSPVQSFEILVILWGDRLSELNPVVQALTDAQFPASFRIVRAHQASGPSTALREGFIQAQGKAFFVANIEQPIDPEFLATWIAQARSEIKNGVDLVRGNRRLLESHFKIPVRFLALVYGRHHLSLHLNSWLYFFLDLKSQDSPSPYLAFSRRLATEAFCVQRCKGALFFVEMSLICRNLGLQERDLPISVRLSLEKSLRRTLWESFEIAIDLFKLLRRSQQGSYLPLPELKGITADDWGLSPGVNSGILQLAQQGVIKRVSLMANCPFVSHQLKELMAIPGIELGLHFNLTYGRSLSKNELFIPSPARFLFNWLNPRSGRREQKSDWARNELISQLKKLKELDVPIHYLDGHHHIHLTPGLIPALSETLATFGIRRVRLPWDTMLWKTSQFPLLILSALAQRNFRSLGWESLPCYYPPIRILVNHTQFRGALRSRLLKMPHCEVITHPAAWNDVGSLEIPESYQDGRVDEFLSLQMLRPNRELKRD